MNQPYPLAIGAAGGTLGTAILGLVSQVLFNHQYRIPFPDPVGPESSCFCPDLPELPDFDPLAQPRWLYLLVGVGLGICSGALLDLCLIARERWRRFVAGQLLGVPTTSSRPLYKVLA